MGVCTQSISSVAQVRRSRVFGVISKGVAWIQSTRSAKESVARHNPLALIDGDG